MNQELLSIIIKEATAILTIVLLTVGTVVLEYTRKWLKARSARYNLDNLTALAERGIMVAEQISSIGDLSNSRKKAIATNVVKNLAKGTGLKVSDDQISDVIEAGVSTVKSWNSNVFDNQEVD